MAEKKSPMDTKTAFQLVGQLHDALGIAVDAEAARASNEKVSADNAFLTKQNTELRAQNSELRKENTELEAKHGQYVTLEQKEARGRELDRMNAEKQQELKENNRKLAEFRQEARRTVA